MSASEVIIAFLLGLVTNILTFLITKHYTTSQDREAFRNEQAVARGNTADAAIGHLRSSYLAVKKLELSVLDQQRRLKDEKFELVVWGIAQSLEQIRLGLQGHMNVWKSDLPDISETRKEVIRFIDEDIPTRPYSPREEVIGATPKAAPVLSAVPSTLGSSSDGASKLVLPGMLSTFAESSSERVIRMMMENDIPGLERHIADLVERNGSAEEIVSFGGVLAINGSTPAYEAVLTSLYNRYNELSSRARSLGFKSIVQHLIRGDRERESIEMVEELAGKLLHDPELDLEDKARVCAEMGAILYRADEPARAAEWEEKALQMMPENDDYARNLALSYNALGDLGRAELLIEKALSGKGINNPRLLETAIKFYHKRDNSTRVAELLPILERVDRVKALMVKFLIQNGGE